MVLDSLLAIKAGSHRALPEPDRSMNIYIYIEMEQARLQAGRTRVEARQLICE